jgi:hypothetical protein
VQATIADFTADGHQFCGVCGTPVWSEHSSGPLSKDGYPAINARAMHDFKNFKIE